MQKIRILYISSNNDEVGGADYCLFKTAYEAKAEGYEPFVMLRSTSNVLDLYKRAGIPVFVGQIFRLQQTRNLRRILSYPFKILKSILFIIRIIKKEKIDLVHTNEIIDFYGNFAALLAGVPSCQHVRWIVNNKWMLFFLSSFSKLFATKIICISHSVKEIMFGKKPNKKINIIYDWLDMEVIGQTKGSSELTDELGINPCIKVVGCVGRVESWKGQHIFIQAAEKVIDKNLNTHFIVVGGPTTNKEAYLEKLKKEVNDSQYAKHITFLGHRTDVANIMRQCAVVVHSSIAPEPFGLVVMEAMYCGSVVVGANAGGVVEQILPGENGYLYRPGDSTDMANMILKALNNPDRINMGLRAKAYVTQKFNKEASLKEIFGVYNQLSGKKRENYV
jgi:glycosyltransferase involved in cell wall biosynthesis